MEKKNNVIKFPKRKARTTLTDQQRWWFILFLYFAVIISVFVIEKIRLGMIE